MHTRQHACFDRHLADLVKGTVVRTDMFLQYLFAEDLLTLELEVLRQLLAVLRPFRQLLLQLVLELFDLGIALKLRELLRIQGIFQPIADLGGEVVGIRLVELHVRYLALRLARAGRKVLDAGHKFLDLTMSELDGIHYALFFDLARAGLNHRDAFIGAHNHNVQRAHQPLGIGGIHDELTLHDADTDCTYRAMKRNIAQRQRTARAINAQDIRIVFTISGVHERNNLGLVTKRLRKEGPDRPIDLTAG